MVKNQNRLYDIAFALLLPLAALLTLPWHNGFLMGDDYLSPARELLKGNIDLSTCWSNRIGTYLPYAVGMYLFGFGTWLTTITTLEFLLLLVVVYFLVGKHNKSIGFIAACLLGVSAIMHESAGVIMGDMAAALTSNAVVLVYFYYSFYVSKSERASKRWGVLTALLVVGSFLVKESVVFYVPVLFVLLWINRKEPGTKIFFRSFLFTSLISAILFLAFYAYKTGNPFHRLHILETGPNANDSNYATASWGVIFKRITWQPFQLLVESYSFGCLFFLTGLQLLVCRYRSNKVEQFFCIYLIGTLAMWWFGSQGVSSYNPLALAHRIWLPLIVPMAVNSAFFILRVLEGNLSVGERKKITAGTLLFLVFGFICLWISHISYMAIPALTEPRLGSVAIWYAIIAICVLLSIYTNKVLDIIPPVRSMLFCILIVPFIIGGFQLVFARLTDHEKTEYDREKEMIQYTLALKPANIIADSKLAHFYYIYTLDMDKKLPFTEYSFISLSSIKPGDYLLLNMNRQSLYVNKVGTTLTFTRASDTVPVFVTHPEQNGFVLIKENTADRLYQYKPVL